MKIRKEYKTTALVLKKIKYYKHQWVICVEFKTHYYVRKEWYKRENMDVGECH